MGLEIKGTKETPIKINGTDVVLPSVYMRMDVVCRADGRTLEAVLKTYASKAAFKMGSVQIDTNVPQGGIISDNGERIVLKEDENQGVEVAHKYAIEAMGKLGFEAKEV